MESNYYTAKREDKQLLVITHLCQLLTFITGVGGLIVPLILWLTQRDRVADMNKHGKEIFNFQLSSLDIASINSRYPAIEEPEGEKSIVSSIIMFLLGD